MKQWYSAFELAGLTGLPALPNNITRKAKAEKWQSRQRTGRGGGKEYAYNSLPQSTQIALIQDPAHHKVVALDANPPRASSTVCSQLPQQVKPTSEQRIDAWLEILRAYEHWCDRQSFETVIARDAAFVRAYNDRQLDLVNWVYAYLPKLSRSTLKAKQKLRREAATIASAATTVIVAALAKLTQIQTYKQRSKLVWLLVASIGAQAKSMTFCSLSSG